MDFDIINVLGNFGFPIAVSIFLLVKLDKSFKQLETAITNLINEIKSN